MLTLTVNSNTRNNLVLTVQMLSVPQCDIIHFVEPQPQVTRTNLHSDQYVRTHYVRELTASATGCVAAPLTELTEL